MRYLAALASVLLLSLSVVAADAPRVAALAELDHFPPFFDRTQVPALAGAADDPEPAAIVEGHGDRLALSRGWPPYAGGRAVRGDPRHAEAG